MCDIVFGIKEMSTRLCNGCLSVHKKPWDTKCTTAIAKAEKKAQEKARQSLGEGNSMATASAPEKPVRDKQPDDLPPPDKAMASHADLVSTLKGLSRQLSAHDKLFEQLTAHITDTEKSQERATAVQSQTMAFGGQGSSGNLHRQGRETHRHKSGTRSKSDIREC